VKPVERSEIIDYVTYEEQRDELRARLSMNGSAEQIA
jgi:hypothetical protein